MDSSSLVLVRAGRVHSVRPFADVSMGCGVGLEVFDASVERRELVVVAEDDVEVVEVASSGAHDHYSPHTGVPSTRPGVSVTFGPRGTRPEPSR